MDFVKLDVEDAYFGKLAYDCDLISEVRDFAVRNNVKSGFFTVIGAVKNVVLGFYRQDARKYAEEEFDEPLEIVSCVGNVALKDGKLFVHAHACLSRKDKNTLGGHLVSARVFAGEVFLFGFKGNLERKFDQTTGLYLIDI